MKQNRGISLFVVIVLLICLSSCLDDALIDQSIPIRDLKWGYKDKPSVTVNINDTSHPYNLYLNLRHTAAYKYANLFVIIHQHYPNGRKTSVRAEVKLAEPDGRWLGKGSGNLYSYQVRFAKTYHFTDTGMYTFSFEQNMRENPLSEIQDVGLRITPDVRSR